MNGATFELGRAPGLLVALAHCAGLVEGAQFRDHRAAPQHRVDRAGDVGMDGHAVPSLDFDEHVERWRRLPFEDRLLRPPPAGLLVPKRHGLHSPHEVGQRGVH